MAGSELTRDQQAELDAITPVYTDESVSKMSRHEQKNYRELLTARDEVEAYMRSQNAAGQPTKTAVAVLEAPEVVDLADAPKLTPSVPKAATSTEPPSQAPGTVETGIPAETHQDPADVAKWEEKLKAMDKRYRDLQASVSPLQQNAATMRKALDAKDGERSALDERLDRLEKLIAESKTTAIAPPPAPPAVDPFAGLAEVDPDLDQRLRALMTTVSAQAESKAKALEQKIREMEERSKQREQQDQEMAIRAFKAEHDAKVGSLVPEFHNLVGTEEGRATLSEWLQKQPPLMAKILHDPYANTPHDVAFVLNQFKAQRAANGAKKPSLGDLAAPAKLAPVIPLNEGSTGLDIFSDEEMAHLDALQHEVARKRGDMEAFIAKAERTLEHKEKLSQRR